MKLVVRCFCTGYNETNNVESTDKSHLFSLMKCPKHAYWRLLRHEERSGRMPQDTRLCLLTLPQPDDELLAFVHAPSIKHHQIMGRQS